MESAAFHISVVSPTGDIIVTCAEDASLCPDDATLADMGQLAIWAEGVNGDVHLEIDQVWAAGC